jgi:hypothetical protein
MAITTNPFDSAAGITYRTVTDDSTDWSGVSNDTYFFNLDDKLPYYKDSSGKILSLYYTTPYKKYVALINQSGTDDPVAVVLENTLSGIPTWTRVQQGEYNMTLLNEFGSAKISIIVGAGQNWSSSFVSYPVIDIKYVSFSGYVSTDDYITFNTFNILNNTAEDSSFYNTTVEIIIYG